MLSINTNLSSLIAQNSMSSATKLLNQAIERMTTGYKINHSKDNAANYSIATNMTTKINSYMVAEDNCAMGLDMLASANGSLDQISDKLTRLRDLQTQASNGTYGSQSLNAINAEANALVDEIDRLYKTAEYNGKKIVQENKNTVEKYKNKVVSEDCTSLKALADYSLDQNLTADKYYISTTEDIQKLATLVNNGLVEDGCEFILANDINISSISNWTPIGTSTNSFKFVFDGNGYTISGMNIVDDSSTTRLAFFGEAKNATIKNLSLEDINIDIKTNKNLTVGGLVAWIGPSDINIENCYVTGNIAISSDATVNAGSILGQTIWGYDIVFKNCSSEVDITVKSDAMVRVGGLIGDSQQLTSLTLENCHYLGDITVNTSEAMCGGIVGDQQTVKPVAITNSSVEGDIYVKAPTSNKTAVFVGSNTSQELSLDNCSYSANLNGVVPEVDTTGHQPISKSIAIMPRQDLFVELQIGTDSKDSSRISFISSVAIGNYKQFRNIGIGDSNYIEKIDSMLSTVNAKQTEFGAVESRLTSALDEISIQYENLVSSRSTIRDADIAEVSSEYIRQQILQQASATLMATANQSPSIALQLI